MSLRSRLPALQRLLAGRRSWRTYAAIVFGFVLAATLAPVAESPRPARIEGLVTGEHRAPLAGARIRLSSVDARAPLAETTNSAGTFTFSQVPPGRYRVDVSYQERHASSDAALLFEAGELYTLDLPMFPSADGE